MWMNLKGPFICGQTGGGVTNIHPLIHRNLTMSCHKAVSHISDFVGHNYSTLCHIWKHWKLFKIRFWSSSNSQETSFHIIEKKTSHSMLMLMMMNYPPPQKRHEKLVIHPQIFYMTTNGSKVRLLKCYSLLLNMQVEKKILYFFYNLFQYA